MQKENALALLRQMLGPAAEFREGQWEAINLAANRRQRVLVVQRTGWGKSVVYFLAAKILRDAGAGPTLLISPLLSLMRNQILAAEKLGIRAAPSTAKTLRTGLRSRRPCGWRGRCADGFARAAGQCGFLQKLLPLIRGSLGLFVVDEAHCISDWGHDFSPDYRRIVRILRLLPAKVPVLCTTATANDRVVQRHRIANSQSSYLRAGRWCGVRSSSSTSRSIEALFSRGMWAVTRMDELYPARLRDTLKHQAPTVLFGAGDPALLRRGGVAVIGSRNIDELGAAFAKEVGRKAVAAKLPVVSGGARGTDRLAMEGAIESGGVAFGVLADSLERTIRQPDLRQLLLDSQLVLLTPYAPTAGFSVGGAMGRNKVIYGLADFAVVVSSDFQTGGTWAGATEALKAGWCPVFVRDGANVPKGNRELQKLGATPLSADELQQMEDLGGWLRLHSGTKPGQQDLFG